MTSIFFGCLMTHCHFYILKKKKEIWATLQKWYMCHPVDATLQSPEAMQKGSVESSCGRLGGGLRVTIGDTNFAFQIQTRLVWENCTWSGHFRILSKFWVNQSRYFINLDLLKQIRPFQSRISLQSYPIRSCCGWCIHPNKYHQSGETFRFFRERHFGASQS